MIFRVRSGLESISICDQLLQGLIELEKSNSCHNDLKPENVILEADNQTLRLIDLGDAQNLRIGGYGLNMAGPLSDSGPEFLPPESISKGPVGPYTDMWSFGVILYVLLR